MLEANDPWLSPSHPLVGRCFIVRSLSGVSQAQGIVRAVFPSNAPKGELALVQFFEAALGEPNTLALIALTDMSPEPISSFGGWVFFDNHHHLRSYFDNYQTYRDQHSPRYLDANQDAS